MQLSGYAKGVAMGDIIVYPDEAQVHIIDFYSETAGVVKGLALLIYGSKGPIHDASYISKLSGWTVYPKGAMWKPSMYQHVTTQKGLLYAPMGYSNSWWLGASQLQGSTVFKEWIQLPSDEYVLRLYFRNGDPPRNFEL